MTTAVFTTALTSETTTSSKLSLIAKRLVNALMESRSKSAAQELRRYEAFIQDLSRRQDHSSDFLIQDNHLPFKL